FQAYVPLSISIATESSINAFDPARKLKINCTREKIRKEKNEAVRAGADD
ncbi:hypothetical protein TrRE_jg1202, partial [Triparma retinervis]